MPRQSQDIKLSNNENERRYDCANKEQTKKQVESGARAR